MGLFILCASAVISALFLAFVHAYELWHVADTIERQNALLQESEGE